MQISGYNEVITDDDDGSQYEREIWFIGELM